MAHVAAVVARDDAELVAQMARNIRSLGQQRGLRDKDVAALIGMSAPKYSSRINGETQWSALEIRQLASTLGVSADAIYAADEPTFRAALTASRTQNLLYKCETPSDLPVSSPVSLASSRRTPDRRFRRSTDRPLMATV